MKNYYHQMSQLFKALARPGGFLLFLIFICGFIVTNNSALAQCSKPLGETCVESRVFCSLNELNGFSCGNQFATTASPCIPLCSKGGSAEKTGWWAFASNSVNVSITVLVGACQKPLDGLQFGVWGDCICNEELACNSIPCTQTGNSGTMTMKLIPCKTYYLWIDGCNGDLCDFTITTSGGAAPSLVPLSPINNLANGIIPVCLDVCDYKFSVTPQPGGCVPNYIWTLDGEKIGENNNEIKLSFPQEGDFNLCVTAVIGNLANSSICNQQGPKCAIVQVRPAADKMGVPRTICHELTVPSGYKWHNQRIFSSGIYREQFTGTDCCPFDSVVQFNVLDVPEKLDVFYITCDNKPYIDGLGRSYTPCKDHFEIVYPKSTDVYRCDSSILLTAVNVNFLPTWRLVCLGGIVELSPNLKVTNSCSAGETYQFEYRWYKKNDLQKNTISNDERIIVESINEDYCLEVTVLVSLGTESMICSRTFCETLSEEDLKPSCFSIAGKGEICLNSTTVYWIDTFISQKVRAYSWTIDGGQIISNTDSVAVEVKWFLNAKDTGTICVSYKTDCGTSCQKCKAVYLRNQIAGYDFKKRGLSAYLDARPDPNGRWRLVSGPYQVRIEDPTNPRTKFTAFNYGTYCFEWTINDPNCQLKDTLCVELHSYPIVSPEYPKKIYFDRARAENNQTDRILFTPNLIKNNGESFIHILHAEGYELNYTWLDIYGRVVYDGELFIESNDHKLIIQSPLKNGFYFLLINTEGQQMVKKICVME